jgi:ABC-2 type transport system ATP-binding protein
MGHSLRREALRVRSLCGYLPESPAFYGWMTAREYLAFAARLSAVSSHRICERLDFLLELVGLRKEHAPIRSFSRGMRQRLGIAQALVHDPPVLLLDEPTSALDPLGRREVLETISSLRGSVTIFFSTHILADAERVADWVAILQGGKLVVQERVEDLRHRYQRRILRLEVDGDPSELLVRLRRETWMIDVQREESKLTLRTSDLLAAETRTPVLLAECKLPLRRLEISEPTLEEIFLEALGESHE